MNSIPIVLAFVGLIVLVWGSVRSVANIRALGATPAGSSPRHVMRVAGVIGLLLSVLSVFAAYPIGPSLRIVGVPFMAATLQQGPSGWQDFTGPFTGVVMSINAVTMLVLPQLFVRVSPTSPAR